MTNIIFQWGSIIILVLLSGLFSGLTLGLLGLDLVGLEIVMSAGDYKQKKYAQRIYPLRKRGNLLLCTLLLGNVAVNSLLSIIMADLTSGVVGFLVSTGVIVILGEIAPQAICSRHGLAIGGHTYWIVYFFLIILFPITYPISKALDLILGREIGTIYSKNELKQLIQVYQKSGKSDLTSQDTTLLSGALDFSSKTVESVMTPLEDVFMLEIDQILDRPTINHILEIGYSRIPIYEKERKNIVGLLLVKDLLLLDPEEKLTIRKVLSFCIRYCPKVFSDTGLDEMLNQFKTGKSHIAIVHRVVDEGETDPFYDNIGIVTLEDVIEEIIQDEIVDETDIYVDNRSFKRVERQTNKLIQNQLDKDLITKIVNFLSKEIDYFKEKTISKPVLERLVYQARIQKFGEIPTVITPANIKYYMLYEKNTLCPYFTLILQGKVEVIEETLESETVYEVGQFGYFGLKALIQENYKPSFSAKVIENNTVVMYISKALYDNALSISELKKSIEIENKSQIIEILKENNNDEFTNYSNSNNVEFINENEKLLNNNNNNIPKKEKLKKTKNIKVKNKMKYMKLDDENNEKDIELQDYHDNSNNDGDYNKKFKKQNLKDNETVNIDIS